jgi:hypothetical protein
MASWHWFVCDTHGKMLGEITTATSRTASWFLTDACTASFTMDAMDPRAKLIKELSTDLMLYRGNELMFRGRFTDTQDTIGSPGDTSGGSAGTDPSEHTVDFNVIDYRGMLAHRIVPDNAPTYIKQNQATIAWKIIDLNDDQVGSWNLTKGQQIDNTNPPAPVRDYGPQAGTYIDQAVNDIGNLDHGFEWEIDPTMAFNTWTIPPLGNWTQLGRGQNIGMKLTYGDNVSDVQRAIDASVYANVVRYSGNISVGSTTTDIVKEAIYTGSFGTIGRWEIQVSNNNQNNANNLQQAALAELVKDANLIPTYQLTLTRGWWDRPQMWLGDIVTVTVHHGRLNESLQMRVTQIDLYVGDDADEEVIVVTVGPRYASLLSRIYHHDRIITQISKTSN